MLDDYPHPNPGFPATPRPAKGITWRGLVGLAGLFVVSGGLLVAGAVFVEDLPFVSDNALVLAALAVIGLLTGALGTPLAAYNLWRLRDWRHGEIVPVRVVRAGRGGGVVDVLLAAGTVFVPFLGYVLWATVGGRGARVAYIDGGRVRRCVPVSEDTQPHEGETVWMIKPRFPFPARLLEDIWGPEEELQKQPPAEVAQWLDRALAQPQARGALSAGQSAT
jgi:hypothetical protein